jgi:hypothetical protein
MGIQIVNIQKGANMSLIAKTVDNESKYPEVATGVHKARCVKVIDLGTQENNYDGQVTWKHQCMIIWEVPSQSNNNGEPLTISKFYTLSLHEKATLGNDLSSWRGRPFTEMEKKGFDISKLVGVPCMINVMEGKNGKPRVSSIMPLSKDEQLAEQFHEAVVFSVDEYQKGNRDEFNKLPDGIRNIILRSKELVDSQDMGDERNGQDVPDLTNDEDIPF